MSQNSRPMGAGGPGSRQTRPQAPPGWSSGSGNSGGGQGSGQGGGSSSEVHMLMDQVRQLQQQVQTMSGSQGGGQNSGGQGPFDQFQPNEQRILLVSNVPNSVASCDALFFMFERFGVVERIKILHNKRSAALIQMQTSEMAEHAVNEQGVLNRIGADIYVNFSNKVNEIRMPNEKGLPEDGLSKDFTYDHSQSYNQYGNYGNHAGSGGPFSGSGPRGGPSLPPVGHDNGVCILVSQIPDEMANPDSISNLFGHYGDVMKVKVLHNKKDCALIQMAKPHQAALCRQFLDQVKIDNNTLCVSFSRIQGIRMPTEIDIENDKNTKDFTNIRGVHRFRNHMIAAKLSKNLMHPTAMLHVANMPEDYKATDLQKYLVEEGLTVKDCQDCGKEGSGMALVQMASEQEAIKALSKFHNITPPGIKTKNNAGLCFSFSGRKAASDGAARPDKDGKAKDTETPEKDEKDTEMTAESENNE